MQFAIEFSTPARDQQVVTDAIETRLTHEPDKPARNRKQLADNRLAPWELRVGDFRVFYDIKVDRATVVIVAVGRKVHNRLIIGGEEIEL